MSIYYEPLGGDITHEDSWVSGLRHDIYRLDICNITQLIINEEGH